MAMEPDHILTLELTPSEMRRVEMAATLREQTMEDFALSALGVNVSSGLKDGGSMFDGPGRPSSGLADLLGRDSIFED